MSARYSRRRRTLRPWVLPAALSVAGFTAGLLGSHVKPWGFAMPPPLPEPQPRPGLVLSAGDVSALVHSGLTFAMPDGSRVGVVSYLRGRTGREALRVLGCDEGRGGAGAAARAARASTVAPRRAQHRRHAGWRHLLHGRARAGVGVHFGARRDGRRDGSETAR